MPLNVKTAARVASSAMLPAAAPSTREALRRGRQIARRVVVHDRRSLGLPHLRERDRGAGARQERHDRHVHFRRRGLTRRRGPDGAVEEQRHEVRVGQDGVVDALGERDVRGLRRRRGDERPDRGLGAARRQQAVIAEVAHDRSRFGIPGAFFDQRDAGRRRSSAAVIRPAAVENHALSADDAHARRRAAAVLASGYGRAIVVASSTTSPMSPAAT